MSSFGRFFLKLFLLACLLVFALVDYRIFSFNKGFSIVRSNGEETITIDKLIDYMPTKVEYYKKTIPDQAKDYDYKLYIETNSKNYLFDAAESEIKTLQAAGWILQGVKPQEITPVPFYIEIIVGIVILIIPFGRGREKEE